MFQLPGRCRAWWNCNLLLCIKACLSRTCLAIFFAKVGGASSTFLVHVCLQLLMIPCTRGARSWGLCRAHADADGLFALCEGVREVGSRSTDLSPSLGVDTSLEIMHV
jgi:hypothetical protein